MDDQAREQGAKEERKDFIRWLRDQAAACSGERQKALLDAAAVREQMPLKLKDHP